MAPVSLNRQTKRDFQVCLVIWFVLELVCFLLIPALGVVPFATGSGPWLSWSIALGLGGALLFAVSSQILITLPTQNRYWRKIGQRLGGMALAWLGLAGVIFPILVLSRRVFLSLLERLVN